MCVYVCVCVWCNNCSVLIVLQALAIKGHSNDLVEINMCVKMNTCVSNHVCIITLHPLARNGHSTDLREHVSM
jgi:hypothetical protein